MAGFWLLESKGLICGKVGWTRTAQTTVRGWEEENWGMRFFLSWRSSAWAHCLGVAEQQCSRY